MWLAVVLGIGPLLGWLLWWWNDIWYGLVTGSLQSSNSGTKLPPGHMGLPIIGEMFMFLWYFKFLKCPDDYINFKRRKYGDGIGIYKTHLFGKPSVIVFSPAATKYVFRAEEQFVLEWPNVEIVGKSSIVAVHGKTHTRLRSFVSKSINQPEALRRIAHTVQPRMIASLQSWAKRGIINSYKEVKKVTFENIGMYFASFEPGPTLDTLAESFMGMVGGIRSYPLNIPGFAYHRGIQGRKKTMGIFRKELEKRKKDMEEGSQQPMKDLMDGLMKLKDEDGSQLSDIEVLDNIVSILVAGYESTTLATMWAIYYIAKYPKVLQKLRDENLALKKTKTEEFVMSDEILKMKYTMKVVDETIRMANIAAIVFRTTTEDVNYKGYTIPKGWNVMLWVRYLHTDPDNFNDPLCFNPDRWDAFMAPGTYQVFGGGSRICAGNMLARLQLAIFLYHLSTGYKWELVNPDATVTYLSHPKPEDGIGPLLGWLLWWWNDIWYGFVTGSFRSSNGGTKLPPGHMGLPIIGEMFMFLWYFKFLKLPDEYINFKRRKYGDGIGIYKTHLFGKPSVIVFSPAATKYVFRDEEKFMLEWPNVEIIGKSSIVAVHGKTHTRLRSFITRSTNQPEALRRIAHTLQPRMISALQSWANRGTVKSYKEVKKVTFENIGMYFASFEPGPTLDTLSKSFMGMVGGIRSYPLNIPGFAYHRGLQGRKKTIGIFREELEKRKKNMDKGSIEPMKDLMDGLMKLKDEDGSQLSDIEVLDNIVSVLVAGYESTTLATMWAVYYLAKYPKVLQKLRDENMALKRTKTEQFVTSDEIFKMKYTLKVVDETIRMANIAAIVFRTTTEDVNYKGYTIPKGWRVMLWVRYLHTDPNNFEDPLCFNPDRWDALMAPGTYQVFGGGSRICAGNMLARLQLAIFLYHLSTGYKWELVNPDAKVTYLSHPKPEDGAEITIQKL
ncbi:hypothetical protein LXL04_008627 [Taraxacum kok-saghyz]